jgi:hypothetical protein
MSLCLHPLGSDWELFVAESKMYFEFNVVIFFNKNLSWAIERRDFDGNLKSIMIK